jgi:hypothetical protein
VPLRRFVSADLIRGVESVAPGFVKRAASPLDGMAVSHSKPVVAGTMRLQGLLPKVKIGFDFWRATGAAPTIPATVLM